MAGRNPALARSINKFSRSASIKRSGKWRFFGKGAAGKKTAPTKFLDAPVPSAASKWYAPATGTVHQRQRRKKVAKLRASITPGAVLIVLAGRFRGKRVVFLKQLSSGLLLVTGPFKINGVPLRRLNQAYVLATSTSVSLDGVAVSEHINDSYFARVNETRGADAAVEEGEFFASEKKSVEIDEGRKDTQKSVDAALLVNIAKVPALRAYLNARFSLKKGQAPHDMKW